MARWLRLVLLTVGAGLCGLTLAAAAALVVEGSEPISLNGQPHTLVPRGSVTVRDVAAGRLDKQMTVAEASIFQFTTDNELWIKLRLQSPSKAPASWRLEVPLPSIDEVALFEPHGGQWTELSAGDRVALERWPSPGRFPRFELRFDPGEARQVFVRVRNAFPAPVPARLIDAAGGEQVEQRVDVGFGFVLGTLALLVAACLVQAALYRGTAYFLYGAYALLLGLAFASLTGLAGQHVWGNYPEWGDASKTVFPLAGAGVSVWLVRELCRVRTRGRALAHASAAIGTFAVVVAVAFAVLRQTVPWLGAAGMVLSAVTVVTLAVWTWRRGDAMGGWVLAAHAPLIAVTALIVLRMFAIAPLDFDANFLLSAAIGAILPLLLVALHLRSKEYLAVQTRARELPSIDPLTGLLSPRLFRDRVQAAVRRYARSRHNAVILYIRLANYTRIHDVHGSAAAEQSMIRAAMKLQRLMPDADCIGRVGESTMGLIFETVTARAAIMERASRLVAHGLMPLPGLKPEVTLNLHVAANVLAENPLEARQLKAAMESVLNSMSPRTRRPIRFLEPGAAGLAAVDGDPDRDEEGPPDALSA